MARQGGGGDFAEGVFDCQSMDEQQPAVTPEEDPAREEALLVSGLALEDRTHQWQLLEMMRDKDNKPIGLREFGPPPEVTANTENPLLLAFVAGYQSGIKGR